MPCCFPQQGDVFFGSVIFSERWNAEVMFLMETLPRRELESFVDKSRISCWEKKHQRIGSFGRFFFVGFLGSVG